MKDFFKNNKGQFGYISTQSKKEILKTVVMFGLSLAIYWIGYATTGDNKNLLTVVAVLGCLPASKSAVNMIMFIRAKGCSQDLHEQIAEHSEDLPQMYDCVLTSYERNYEIAHMVYRANNLIGITENPKCKIPEAEKHILNSCAQDGIKDITVKIFTDPAKYVNRMDQLRELESEEGSKTAAILSLMKVLSI